jgi:hypothetical protein
MSIKEMDDEISGSGWDERSARRWRLQERVHGRDEELRCRLVREARREVVSANLTRPRRWARRVSGNSKQTWHLCEAIRGARDEVLSNPETVGHT